MKRKIEIIETEKGETDPLIFSMLSSIKPLLLYKSFSSKHVNSIYEDLINNQMNLQSTPLLNRYKIDIQNQFFNTNKLMDNIYLSHKQKSVLLNIFKVIRLFKLVRANLIAIRLFNIIPQFNMDITKCISGYLY